MLRRRGNIISGAPSPDSSTPPVTPRAELRLLQHSATTLMAAAAYLTGAVTGKAPGGTGTIASERVLNHSIASPFFTGPLRSPDRLQNTFANESFVDEVAAGQ